jgi:hypothetical protein
VARLRPCLDCGQLSMGPRCRGCTNRVARATLRGKRERRPYPAHERARRAEVVRTWIATHGHVCPGYETEAHPSGDLTADHPHDVSLGGSEGQELSVLCRSCNSRKSHRVIG